MDSDDYYMESGDEDFYSDGTEDYNDVDDDVYGDEEDDSAMISSPRSHKSYVVLKEEDIRRKQEGDIGEVSMILSLNEVEASVLLLHYHWNVGKVNDEWFADEQRVRTTVGILEAGSVAVVNPHGMDVKCGICLEYCLSRDIVPIVCGHTFCSTCWTGYISTAISDGPGCLMQKCPEPSCPVAVGRDMVEKLASVEDRDKYDRCFLRSYVEENKKTKWCPAPGCEHAIEFSATGSGSSYDVSCLCSHSFCWNCTEETHRPVDCDTVSQWIRKNSSEAENTTWILANSKSCPKCKRPIEKNHGCMHMTCTKPCRHEFCWLCLDAWANHGDESGGFYSCNKYAKAKGQGLYDEAEAKREMAKNSLEKYTHYYERWAGNQTSRQKAIGDLEKFLSEDIVKLSDE